MVGCHGGFAAVQRVADDCSPASQQKVPDCDPTSWLDDHGDALYTFAIRRVGSTEVAEDLVQEALLSALRSLNAYQGASSVRTWLISILRNRIVDYFRLQGRRGSIDGTLDTYAPFKRNGSWRRPVGRLPGPHTRLERVEFLELLNRCLGSLSTPLAQVFRMRELDQLEGTEIADLLCISPETLRVRLHRARIYLRDCLQKHGLGGEPTK
jgi:RNA polymerase sigma-70 factor, ECF subfamily